MSADTSQGMALLRAKGTVSPGLGSAGNYALPGIYYFCFHTHPRTAPRLESRLLVSRGLVGSLRLGSPPGSGLPRKGIRFLSQPPSFTPRGELEAAQRLPPPPLPPQQPPATHRVEVPFLTSHIMHLKASALLRKVQTLQSQ